LFCVFITVEDNFEFLVEFSALIYEILVIAFCLISVISSFHDAIAKNLATIAKSLRSIAKHLVATTKYLSATTKYLSATTKYLSSIAKHLSAIRIFLNAVQKYPNGVGRILNAMWLSFKVLKFYTFYLCIFWAGYTIN